MKKLLYILLCLFVAITFVNAEEKYKKQFETEFGTRYNPFQHYAYQSGYLTLDIDDETNEMVLTYYSNKGEVIKTKRFLYLWIEGISGKDIYIYYEDEENEYFAILDENLEIKKQVTAPNVVIPNSDIPDFLRKIRHGVAYKTKYTDNGYYYLDHAGNVHKYTKELAYEGYHQVTKTEFEQLFPEYKILLRLDSESEPNVGYYGYDYKDGKAVVPKEEFDHTCMQNAMNNNNGQNEYELLKSCISFSLILYDDNLNLIWEKDQPEEKFIVEVSFVNNYIVAIAEDYPTVIDDNYIYSDTNSILIYDMKGNLIQTIDSQYRHGNIVPSPYGFIVYKTDDMNPAEPEMMFGGLYGVSIEGLDSPDSFDGLDKGYIGFISDVEPIEDQNTGRAFRERISTDPRKTNHVVFSAVLNVETKVASGKGTIEVSNTSIVGEPVTFTIKPEKGYTLGEIRVTDADGNTVVFKDYTFTMPSADVTIEVVFQPKNPETRDIAIATIAIVTIFAGASFALYRKKMKEMN